MPLATRCAPQVSEFITSQVFSRIRSRVPDAFESNKLNESVGFASKRSSDFESNIFRLPKDDPFIAALLSIPR